MKFSILALILIQTIAQFHGRKLRITPKIVGGSSTTIDKFPFLVSLRYFFTENQAIHFCGGSLVSSAWVVTAMHCMGIGDVANMIVVGFTNRSNEEPVFSSEVAQIFPYPKGNDIVLVQLFDPFIHPCFTYIALEKNYDDSVRDVLALGWGYEEEDGNSASENLKGVKGKVLPFEQCRKDAIFTGDDVEEEERLHLSHDVICTVSVEGEGPCQGDSGGAVVVGTPGAYTLVGVVSYGLGCARGNADMQVRISSFYRWIKKVINSKMVYYYTI